MAGLQARRAKAPTQFGDDSSSGIGALMAYMMAQQKGAGLKQEMGEGAIPTRGTDPSTGTMWENPENNARVKGAEAMATRTAETASPRSIMRGTLVKAKQLLDTVPAPEPGIKRIIQGSKNAWEGNVTQERPQIAEFHKMVDSALTAFARTMFAEKGNVSDRDINRIKNAFTSIEWDTEDARALGWNRAIDTYNDVIGSYQTLKQEKIDKRELMSPKEIGRSRLLSGVGDFTDLTDDEIDGVFDGPMYIAGNKKQPIVPRPILERAITEYEKRGLHLRGNKQ